MSVAPGGSGYFSVGDVLGRAWTLFSANFLFLVGITLLSYAVIVGVVVVVVLLAVGGGVGAAAAGSRGAVQAIIVVVAILAAVIALAVVMASQAAMLFGAFQFLRGAPVRFGESLRKSFGRIVPLFVLGLLSGLALIVGFVLLIVPFCFLIAMWFVSVPACVIERLGPIESMSRSAALTKGYRWQMLGIFAILFFGRAFVTQLVQLGLAPVNEVLATVAGVIVSSVIALYGYCAVIMTYHDLRVAKEGVDSTQIASVFD
jgi:hypothetical protein